MPSDERIFELATRAFDDLDVVYFYDTREAVMKAIRTAVAEAVAANDKAWQWQLDNPDSMADMMKAAHVRMAIERAVIAAYEEERDDAE